jgi:hypothetical protein
MTNSEIIDELFLMVALTPDETGLPMVVWASPSYNVPHDIRIKAMMAHGSRMDPNNLAVVALRPTPHVLHGHLPAADRRAITAWWQLNQAVLLGYWDGSLNTTQFMRQLRPLSPPIPP